MTPSLQVDNLTKDFGSFRAVDTVSFSVPKGKVIGLLGPNGAGKTTTIHMLFDIISPTSGRIHYFGKSLHEHKQQSLQRINYVSTYNTLLLRASVWENLLVYATLYQVPHPKKRISELVAYFESEDLLHKLYQDLSSGQQTRINIIKSLLNDPELLLMDEPTASLDPDIADKTLTLIEKWKTEKNLSILYTSHNMNEVARICDEVIFLMNGKIIAQDTPLNLTRKVSKATLILTFERNPDSTIHYLKEHNYAFTHAADRLSITTDEKDIPKLIFEISKTGLWIVDITINKPSLEDYFLQISRSKNL